MVTKESEAADVRQRFGEVLRYHRERRNVTLRSVADRCGVSVGVVEEWEAGAQMPDGGQWKKLCAMVDRGLFSFRGLYDRAREAHVAAARERGARSIGVDSKINTALSDKLASVKLSVVPPPAEPRPAGTARKRPRPAGSLSMEAQVRRRAFVRQLLTERPRMRTSGADSVLEAVRKTFGVGISPEAVDEIREELNNARIKADIVRDLPAPVPATVPAMAAQLVAHAAQTDPSVITTAVQLIIESIPDLLTLTVRVGDDGTATVDYSLRKVTTSDGTLKVTR